MVHNLWRSIGCCHQWFSIIARYCDVLAFNSNRSFYSTHSALSLPHFSLARSISCCLFSKWYSNQCNMKMIFDSRGKKITRKSSHAALIKVNSMDRNRKIMKELASWHWFTIYVCIETGKRCEKKTVSSRYSIIWEINFSSRATAHKSQWNDFRSRQFTKTSHIFNSRNGNTSLARLLPRFRFIRAFPTRNCMCVFWRVKKAQLKWM